MKLVFGKESLSFSTLAWCRANVWDRTPVVMRATQSWTVGLGQLVEQSFSVNLSRQRQKLLLPLKGKASCPEHMGAQERPLPSIQATVSPFAPERVSEISVCHSLCLASSPLQSY